MPNCLVCGEMVNNLEKHYQDAHMTPEQRNKLFSCSRCSRNFRVAKERNVHQDKCLG